MLRIVFQRSQKHINSAFTYPGFQGPEGLYISIICDLMARTDVR